MRLTAGSALGDYRIVECIGRGGMASVFKASHPALDRYVAIKVLTEHLLEDGIYLEQFHQEALSAAKLNHPNIVSVFDFGQEAGAPYLVMELIQGGTLLDRILGPMDLREVIWMLRPIASALDYAHAEGVVHRDVKPSNILIRRDGTPALGDFGLAGISDPGRTLPSSPHVMGTPAYMSPEQIAGEAVGPASDRYALAVVAYQMLTGRAPFEADAPFAVMSAHVSQPVPAAPELSGKGSAHLDGVLRKGMAKAPFDRYATADDFVAALTPAAWPASHEESRVPAPRVRTVEYSKTPTVLVVDDGAANRELIEACLAGIDCQVRLAEDGPTALRLIEATPPDLVLLDVQMPGMDGYEVCRRIKQSSATQLLPVVMITALDQTQDRVKALEWGADDFMSKPVQRVELVARVRSALRLKSLYNTLDSAEQVIYSLAAAVEAKDSLTEKHTRRVAEAARHLGRCLGLSEASLDALYRGGMIHDIGKIGIPEAILLKPGSLDIQERHRMQEHPVIGESIIAPLRSGSALLPIIRHHHERFDGQGYPDGLSGAGIPLLARIVSVCDAYDALVSDRPYRSGLASEDAIAVLRQGAGTQWDPELVELLIQETPMIQCLGAA